LSVTIDSADFANLEQLENELKSLHLKVKQTQASTHEQQVVATLELM
jgi:general secretion pathway protein L